MADKFRYGRPQFQMPLTHGASATTVTQAASINGLLTQIKVKAPAAVDGAATLTVNILDSDSDVVYTKASIAANATSITLLTSDLRVPLSGTQSVQIVFSAAQTATDTLTVVTLVVDRG
jgi:hypothetical protein